MGRGGQWRAIMDVLPTCHAPKSQVVVRVRPVLPHELQQEVGVSCSPDGGKVQVTLPDRTGAGTKVGARAYKFDACLPGSTAQVSAQVLIPAWWSAIVLSTDWLTLPC